MVNVASLRLGPLVYSYKNIADINVKVVLSASLIESVSCN